MPKLTQSEIDERLAELEGWGVVNEQLTKEFAFGAYSDGVLFACGCAVLAEARDHHPDLTVTWRKVRVAVSTHSEGGVTEKDFDLAAAIEGLKH